MKQIVAISKEFQDGSATASIGVESSDIVVKAQVEYRQPLQPLVEKIMGPVDALVDKLEAAIPGDQKQLAAGAKQDLRRQIVALLSEPAEG